MAEGDHLRLSRSRRNNEIYVTRKMIGVNFTLRCVVIHGDHNDLSCILMRRFRWMQLNKKNGRNAKKTHDDEPCDSKPMIRSQIIQGQHKTVKNWVSSPVVCLFINWTTGTKNNIYWLMVKLSCFLCDHW